MSTTIKSSCQTGGASVAALLAAMLLTSSVAPVFGQTVLGTVGLYQIPGITGQAVPQTPSSGTVTEGDNDLLVTSQIRRRSSTLRHLPTLSSGSRVVGETGALSWRVYMTDAEAAQTTRFRAAYVSSASVLPDISQLGLRINGVNVGRSAIAAPSDVKPIDFEIPANTLRRGFNDVRLTVEQRHRVDCSVDATYELWTRIEPASTGFVINGETAPSAVSDLAALHLGANGSLPIRVLFDGRMRPQRIEQTILASQAIALSGQFDRPVVSFAADPDADVGINLLVGTASEVEAGMTSAGDLGDIAGPTLSLLRSRTGGAPTLMVTGRNDDEVAAALEQLRSTSKIDGAEAGSSRDIGSAGLQDIAVHGGETVRLQDIGLSHLEFSGRVFRLPIGITMPMDFLPADYGKLSIKLSGAYAPGLVEGAQVQVNVNGRDAASVSLPNSSGGLIGGNDIFIPLAALQPGHNTMQIVAKLPARSDQACDTSVSLDAATKRFLLLGDSAIEFPNIARIGQMPDLSQTMTGGYPYSGRDAHPKLYVPSPDRETLAAAVTLAVRLAIAAGHPIPFSLVLANPGSATGAGLVVAPARSLDPSLMTDIGLDPEAVRRGWKNRADTINESATSDASPPENADERTLQRRVILAGLRTTVPANGETMRDGSLGIERSSAPSDAWAGILAQRHYGDQVREALRSVSDPLYRVAALTVSKAKAQFGLIGAPKDLELGPASSLIVAQGYRATDNGDLITIVTAPDARTLAQSVDALVDPQQWQDLGSRLVSGRLAVMNADAHILQAVDTSDTHLIPTEPLSITNLRLIIAGLLSLHPAIYVAISLLMAALCAITAHMLVKNVGRSNA